MGEGVKLVNNSGKTGVLNNNLFWQRNYKFRTEKLKSEKVSRSTGHDLWEKQDLSCTTIGESEFRLMNSTLQTEVWCNLKRFLSLGRKSVLASPQKWRVSGRVHLFGLLVWGKSFFLQKMLTPNVLLWIKEVSLLILGWGTRIRTRRVFIYIWEPQSYSLFSLSVLWEVKNLMFFT